MKAILVALAALISAATNSHADTSADFFGELVLVTETALQASGVFVGEVDGKCDDVLAGAIDKIVEELDDKDEYSGCKRIMMGYLYASERVSLPEIADGLGLRVLTPADIEKIHAVCPFTLELLPSYEGHPVSGVAAIVRSAEGILKTDIQKPEWRWDGDGGRPATEHEKAIFGDVLDCYKNNLVRIWKESRSG